jgi:hypothetical protein
LRTAWRAEWRAESMTASMTEDRGQMADRPPPATRHLKWDDDWIDDGGRRQ